MPPRFQRHRHFPARQRGAIVIAAAVAMGVCIALMASADIGYLFYIKREFQKAADLAALAGAQRLPGDCTAASASGSAIALANLTRHSFGKAPTAAVTCGVWSPAGTAAVTSPGGQYFASGGSAASFNAVQVVVSGDAPALMPFIADRSLRASAVAVREQATAVVSTATQLASLRLAGLDLAAVGSDGLARITLAGLLDKLGIKVDADIGVGQLNSLLSANNVTLGSLIQAAVQALPNTGAALGAQLTLLNQKVAASAALKEVKIQLGGANSPVSLLTNVGTGLTQDSASLARAALHTELKVTDLISTAIDIAASKAAVSIPDLSIGGVQVRTGIVSPPSVASGPVGAIARQGQVRLSIDIDTATIPLIGPVAAALGTRVHFPLFLDITRGSARINAISCGTTPPTVDVQVNSTILGACVGKVAESLKFTSVGLCDAATPADLQPDVLLKLLDADLLTTSIRVDALSSTQLLPGMKAGETRTTSNDLAVGSAIGNIVNALTSTLAKLGSATPPAAANATPAKVAQDTAKAYLLQTPKEPSGRYNIDSLITLMKNGSSQLAALGDWNLSYPCGFLGTQTCYQSVYTSFRTSVTGTGSGLVGGLLGSVLGGLVVDNCYGIVAQLSFNSCVERNLASYLQTKPGGIVTPPNTTGGTCSTLLCLVLKPVTDSVATVLNGIGSTLASTLKTALGLELGKTSVTVQAISCGNVRLVY